MQSWLDNAEAVVREMAATEVTGEDIRLACEAQGVISGKPNAWGGLTIRLVRCGLLVPTGRYVPMKDKSSHGRSTQVYYLAR